MVLRIASWLLGAAAIYRALVDSRFRDQEGFLLGTACWPLTLGLALILVGVSIGTRWKLAGALLSLAMLGEAAALQVIDAGPRMHYQHYQSLAWMVAEAPGPLLLILVQTVVVVVGAVHWWPALQAWMRRHTRPWQVLALGVAFVLTGPTLSQEVGAYIGELGVATWVRSINLATVLLAVTVVPVADVVAVGRDLRGRLRWLFAGEAPVDRVVLVAALWVTVSSAALSVLSYQRHPHIVDEVAYLYHARYLATGALTMPLPDVLDAFNLELFDYDATRWYASPPPGWPMILAIGVKAGAGWLVNPILAGLCVILTWVLVRDLYDARTARIAAVLLAVSPWHYFLGMSFMTHSASLACALAAACGLVKARTSGQARWALAAGVATGMVGMIRPLEGALVGGLLGFWIIGGGGQRLAWLSIANWVLGCWIVGAGIFAYNAALTGDPTTFPIMEWTDRYMGVNSNAMGFGPDRGAGWELDPNPGHSVFDAIVNSNLNITAINTELFGWGTGSLLLVLLRFVIWPWRRADTLMLACIATVFTAHFFYYFSGGPDFGARYWYLMIVPLIALSASGLGALRARESEGGPHPRASFAVTALVVISLLTFMPWRAIDKYHHYLGMRGDIRSLRAELSPARSLVLVRGRHSPDFASAAIYNPIDLVNADAPVFAWDSDAGQRARLLAQYADRPVFIVEGPALTGRGYEVVEGPLTAQSLLERDRLAADRNEWNPPYAERLPDEFRTQKRRRGP